jgi:hypothetical protein
MIWRGQNNTVSGDRRHRSKNINRWFEGDKITQFQETECTGIRILIDDLWSDKSFLIDS